MVPNYESLTDNDKISTILCPTMVTSAKLVNKYINILFKARKSIDSGEHISSLTFPPSIEQLFNDDLNLSNDSDLSISDSEDSNLGDSSFLSEIDFF